MLCYKEAETDIKKTKSEKMEKLPKMARLRAIKYNTFSKEDCAMRLMEQKDSEALRSKYNEKERKAMQAFKYIATEAESTKGRKK